MPINDTFMLPKRVRTMEQMADLLQTEQTELTQMQRTIAALEQQLTISTSTLLLHRHETIFGLLSNPSEDLDVRRSRLLAKLVSRGTTTLKTLYELIRLVTPCDAEIIEHPEEYALQITLMDDGSAPDLQSIYTLIDEVKPAHLLLRFDIVAPILDESIQLGGAYFKVDTDKAFPHNLRHLFATAFYRASRDIVRLADVLGHSSIETTRIYLLTCGDEHQRLLDRLGFVS